MAPSKSLNANDRSMPYPLEETEYQDQTDKPHTNNAPVTTTSLSSHASLRSSISSHHGKPERPQSSYASEKDGSNHNPQRSQKEEQDSKYLEDEMDSSEEDAKSRPERIPFYRRRRFWCICSISTVLFLAVFIPVFLIVLLPRIAQAMMNSSSMELIEMNMINPQERQLQVEVDAAILGIPSLFAATVTFLEPLQFFWVTEPKGGSPVSRKVGQMTLGTVEKKSGEKARFRETTTFEIEDPALFSEFAKVMIATDSFKWRVTSKVDVVVLGRRIKNLEMDKSMPLSGLNSFAGLKVLAFDIPGDAPGGEGALVSIKASIDNPSPIGMTLGTLTIAMSLETAQLGQIVAKNVVVRGRKPMVLTLEGVIRKQTDPVAIQELSKMVTNYLLNKPTLAFGQGLSVLPDGVNQVSWMTNAIVSSRISIPLLPPEPLDVIDNIYIKDLALALTPQNPWAPTISSTAIGATFKIPFKLSLNITDISETMLTVGYQGAPIADVTTAIWNKTTSDLAQNKIIFTVPASQMPIRVSAHEPFRRFLTDFTQQDTIVVDLFGSARGVAMTSIGQFDITVPLNTSLPLTAVNFAKIHPVISRIVVMAATKEFILLNATIIIDNPSIFDVAAGPVQFQISAMIDKVDEYIGSVVIPDLRLAPGPNPLTTTFRFQPKNLAFREKFFNLYMMSSNFTATIYGDEKTTEIESLQAVLGAIRMTTVVPGMGLGAKLT